MVFCVIKILQSLAYQCLGQNQTQIILGLECSLTEDLTLIWQDVPKIHTPKNLSLFVSHLI